VWKSGVLRAASAVAFAGAAITWTRIDSRTYPYTILRPSSFTYIVLTDSYGRKVDYFFPALGSFTTNVNIYTEPGRKADDEKAYLGSIGATHIRRSDWVDLVGKRLPLIRGDFHGLAGTWTEERTTFTARGLIWHLTLSYDVRYRNLRRTMLRMIRSFRLR